MLPYLFYDTAVSFDFICKNRPYRNAGDLLVSTCPSVLNALKLCGAESRIIDGSCSDYERFTALCYAVPYLALHPIKSGAERILNTLGVYGELSPYSVDELWLEINEIIEQTSLTPARLLNKMNVESLSCRVSPFRITTRPYSEIDVYPVCDLLNVSELITSEENTAQDLSSFISAVTNISEHSAVRLTLDRHYEYARNSKKVELEGYYESFKKSSGLKTAELNCLISYIFVSVAKKLNEIKCPLIVKADCSADELDMLYSYLSLNGIYPPMTVLICDQPERFEKFAVAHTGRTDIGLPSIICASKKTDELFGVLPAGFTVFYQDNVIDTVTLSASAAYSDSLYGMYGEDIGEAMSFTNIKNIFHI